MVNDVEKTVEGKILVAEDNLENQKLMKKFFKKYNVDCMIVSNGQEAIEACQNNDIKTVLMDCQMPVLDGFGATKVIKEEYGDDIEIIAMTAYASEEDKTKCLEAGMDYFLTKSVDLDELETLLKLEELNAGSLGMNVIEKEIRILMKKINFDYESSSDLFLTFIEQLKKGIQEIEKLLDEQAYDGTARKIHQLKGASGAVRIERIRARFENMEDMLKERDYDKVKELINQIKNEELLLDKAEVLV
jgi:CheY-like chemotaxis protein